MDTALADLIRPTLMPVVSPDDIRWRTVAPGIVEISIDVTNPQDEPTSDLTLVIETAAFGAFVPFEPFARVAVESLEPGERRTISLRVGRDALDAVNRTLQGPEAATELVRNLFSGVEWAGNVHVYFDRDAERSVEVHRS